MAQAGIVFTDASGGLVAFGTFTITTTGGIGPPGPAGFGYEFSVKAAAYGAVGDGVADDGPAILACFNAASAAAPQVVFFPPGTYRVGSQIVLDSLSDLTVIGPGASITTTERIELGVFLLQDCTDIRFELQSFEGSDNLADLKTLVDDLGEELQDDEGFADNHQRRWPSPAVVPTGSLPADFIGKHASHAFRLLRTQRITIVGTKFRGFEQALCGILDSDTKLLDVDIVGILDGQTMDVFAGTEGRTGVQDKQIVLWTYLINLFGSNQFHFQGCASGSAGLVVAGLSTNNRSVTGLVKRQPRNLFFHSGTEVFDYFDNGMYLDGCYEVTANGVQIHDTNQAGCAMKLHGSGYSVVGCQFWNVWVGVQFAGQGKTPNLDDRFGHAGIGLNLSNTVISNAASSGLLIQSDGANYPRQAKIHHVHFWACGSATANTVGPSPFDEDNWGGESPKQIRLMSNCGQIEFHHCVIDESAGGRIIDIVDGSEYDAAYTGKAAIKVIGQFHGMGKRSCIRVEGNSVTGYNTLNEGRAHYIEKIIDDSSQLLRVFITSTTYSADGTGGIWEINHPPYGITTDGIETGDPWTDPTLYGLDMYRNEFICCRRGVRLTNVAHSRLEANIGRDIGGSRDTSSVPALFCCERVLTSDFKENQMTPPGARVVWAESDAIYSGNTESGNKGSVNTTRRNTDFLPSDLTGIIGWWTARATQHVLRTDTLGAPSAADAGAWGDTPVGTNNDPVATWVDLISGWRMHQKEYTRRPLYKTNAINSLPALSFDGVDDFLRAIGDGSDATAGEFVIVFKNELEPTASNDKRTLFSTQNESATSTNMRFLSFNTSAGAARLELRHRGGTNDITHDNTYEWIPGAAGPWKIGFIGSNASAYSMDVSDGTGTLRSLTLTGTTNDGKWFRDCTPDGVFTFRQSCTIGASASNYQASSPTWAGDAGTFFKGQIAEIILLDNDQSANRANLFAFLAGLYGTL